MPTETVIITGRDLTVEHRQPTLFDQRASLATDRETERHRHRGPTVPPVIDTPAVDLVALARQLSTNNPWWSTEANNWADAHPDIRPIDAAKRWRHQRTEEP